MTVLAVAAVALTAAPAAAQQYPPQENTITVANTTVCPGGHIVVSARAFALDSIVSPSLIGEQGPTAFETLQPHLPLVEEDGSVSFSIVLSPATPLGHYTVHLEGTGVDGTPLELNTEVDIVSCEGTAPPTPTTTPATQGGQLPRTGAGHTMTILRVGLALAALGGLLVALSRRWRRRRAHAASV